MHALVVDDSAVIRKIAAGFLASWGFEVAQAGDGSQGLAQLASMAKADLILLDWNMPVMDGLAFVQAVRKEARYLDVPLMMMTTNNELDRVSLALEAGANEYLMKPFTRDMMRQKLELLGVLVT
jgi:two-component system, chemotaxis family, chemotaxis protein CheY